MKRMTKRIICLLMLAAVLSPNIVMAQKNDLASIGCNENDAECLVERVSEAIGEVVVKNNIVEGAAKGWLEYNSRLRNVEWKYDQSGYAMFKTLYPRLVKLLEKDLADRFGVSVPQTNQKAFPVFLGPLIGGVSLTIALAVMWDHNHNQQRINAIVDDLEGSGWAHETAVVEANYQFTNHIAPMNTAITAVIPGLNIVVQLSNAIRTLNILSSGKYYNLWQQFHHAQVRQGLDAAGAARLSRDNGRSYIEWAARREGSGGVGGNTLPSGCQLAFWIPAYIVNSFDENGNLVATLHDGHWHCVR